MLRKKIRLVDKLTGKNKRRITLSKCFSILFNQRTEEKWKTCEEQLSFFISVYAAFPWYDKLVYQQEEICTGFLNKTNCRWKTIRVAVNIDFILEATKVITKIM